MYYRSNLWTHSKRVLWLIQTVLPLIKESLPFLDEVRLQILAIIHDDAEIITGDILAGIKYQMSANEKNILHTNELKATNELVKRFSTSFNIKPYTYHQLLNEVAENATPEVKLMKYFDRMDAFGEALHEVFAGNKAFITPIVTNRGDVPLPTDFYINYFSSFLNSNSLLRPLFEHTHPLLEVPKQLDIKTIAHHGTPHTLTSLQIPSQYLHYDFWKQTILKSNDTEETQLLTKQVE